MIRSFLNMTSARSLVDPRGVLTARLTMPVAVYKDDASREAFMDALMPMVQSLPGVRSASATTVVPLARNSWNTNVLLEGETGGPDAPRRMISFALVRPDYFKTMGIALTAGHDFTPQDRLGAPRVAIVSVNAAKKLWPGQDPLGRRFRFSATDTAGPYSVIGVAADVPQSIESKRPPAQIYVAHAQDPNQSVTLLVKHDRDAAAMTATLRHLVQSRDPDMPLFDVRTMDESIRYGLWQQRIYATLMGVFAALALSIAAVGIYGVMAYSVAQRTQEIGIRMALGAARNDVLRLVVGHAFRLTAIGMGIGLAGAYAVTRLMASLLFGVSASDPPTFIGVTVILAFSALIAAWIPADRATRVDPMVALRSE
jgi:putative ABC transport system permease protein